MSTLDIFPVEWHGRDDVSSNRYIITAFGKTVKGDSVAVQISFHPYFYVEIPSSWSDVRRKAFCNELVETHGAVPRFTCCVSRSSMWGYTNSAVQSFVQVGFATLKQAKTARYKMKLRTYEAQVDPIIRFFHVRDLKPSQWITIKHAIPVPTRQTRCKHEYSTSFANVGPSNLTDPPPLTIASWDIECYSATGAFPLSDRPGDHIIQIATSFTKYGSCTPYKRVIVALDTVDPLEGVDLICVENEADVVNEWAAVLQREDIDVLLGYNTDQFDWRYVYGRKEVCVDDETGDFLIDFTKFGKLVEGGGELRDWELNSGAYGQNKFIAVGTPGIVQIDLLQVMRREHKLDSYSLNNVSKHFLGDSKLDLPAWQIFQKFKGSSADRRIIAEYAIKDTELPLQLLSKLSIFENLLEMSNAVSVPLEYLLKRGQQVND